MHWANVFRSAHFLHIAPQGYLTGPFGDVRYMKTSVCSIIVWHPSHAVYMACFFVGLMPAGARSELRPASRRSSDGVAEASRVCSALAGLDTGSRIPKLLRRERSEPYSFQACPSTPQSRGLLFRSACRDADVACGQGGAEVDVEDVVGGGGQDAVAEVDPSCAVVGYGAAGGFDRGGLSEP
jgi:hypothetical protein